MKLSRNIPIVFSCLGALGGLLSGCAEESSNRNGPAMRKTEQQIATDDQGSDNEMLAFAEAKHSDTIETENTQDSEATILRGYESYDVSAEFVPSGWMGDGQLGAKSVSLSEAWRENPHSGPVCVKIVYSPGPSGWAGIYWLNKPDNWGSLRGKDFSKRKYKKITFWARGENGDEIVEFKAGGINSPGKMFADSFEATTGTVALTKHWEPFNINLEGKDLSSVIGGFAWIASRSANPKGLTFFLDDIEYGF